MENVTFDKFTKFSDEVLFVDPITSKITVECPKLDQYQYVNTRFKIIADIWLCGPIQKDSEGNKFPGAYPAGFLNNWKTGFVNYIPSNAKILHVCAGRVPKSEGMTLDIDPKYDPDYLCNAETMRYGSFEEGQKEVPSDYFDWELADPPYNEEASQKYYNKPLVNKSKMIKQMIRTTKVGGFIAILDQTMPQGPPRNVKCVARIGVTSVPNLDMRIFTVFRKISN